MSLLKRWEDAKTKFETATNVKKPKPTGFFKEFFNNSGLTKALKEADVPAEALSKTSKDDEKKKLIQALKPKSKNLTKAIAEYVKVLEKEAKAEKDDNNAKTDLYRHLKVLKAELLAIDAGVVQLIDRTEVAMTGIAMKDQAPLLFRKALAKTIADAALAVKTIQAAPDTADPGKDTKLTVFRKFFGGTNDTPGRKIQTQLQNAAKEQKANKLTSKFSVDPGSLADDLTPWQAQNKNLCRLEDTATPKEVVERLDAFKKLLKMAARFNDELQAM